MRRVLCSSGSSGAHTASLTAVREFEVGWTPDYQRRSMSPQYRVSGEVCIDVAGRYGCMHCDAMRRDAMAQLLLLLPPCTAILEF